MDSSPERTETLFPALRSWWWVAVAAAVTAATVGAGFVVTSFGPRAPELGIDILLSHGRSGVLVALSKGIDVLFRPAGAIALVLLICLYLFWYRVRTLQALAFGSVVAAGWLASAAGKVLVSRPRPPADATHSLLVETASDSFPSGHTAFALALALAFTIVLARSTAQRWATAGAGALFVAIVAFSRLYLGVHYLSDVLGSVLISGAAVLAWIPVWNNLVEPRLTGAAVFHKVRAGAPGRA